MCRPRPGAEQGALVTRNIITGTILGQGTLPPGCHATLMPVTCHYCPCNRCHHLMSCVFYLITGESGSELGAGLVVSPCPVQLTAHPGAPSLSSLFLQSLDQSKTNPCCGNNLDWGVFVQTMWVKESWLMSQWHTLNNDIAMLNVSLCLLLAGLDNLFMTNKNTNSSI